MSGFEELPGAVPQVFPAGSLPRLFGDVDEFAVHGAGGCVEGVAGRPGLDGEEVGGGDRPDVGIQEHAP